MSCGMRPLLTEDGGHGEAEVAHEPGSVENDECPGRVHGLGGECMAVQPIVEFVAARGESGEVVVFGESLEAARRWPISRQRGTRELREP